MMPTPVILLKEGTDTSQGVPQLVSNINACQVIAEAVRTTLGPRGMDKLMVDSRGKATISNDGATILKLLDVVHPAAKTLVDIAKSQDAEVGDGTTSVTLLVAEFLRQLKPYVEEGLHPQTIIRAFRTATVLAVKKINDISVPIKKGDKKEQRELLIKCASTALNSKLIAGQKGFFSQMVVDAVMSLDELLPLKMIGIKKVQGGALEESQLVDGVAFKKTFSYAGFEMQPKRYDNPKIALLNVELELKAEKENAEVRVSNVQDYQAIVDAEWNILYDKLEKIHTSGAKVVLSKLPIGDVATQYFADRDLFCAGRVQEEDLKRTMMACGGSIQTSVGAMTPNVLGQCALFEEVQVGGERYNFFKGCPKTKTCTMLLRGGAEQFMEETERSLHDAIMIVRRAIKNDSIVAGGGAIEMELSKYLRDYSRTIPGKQQLLIGAYAKALEIIPRQLCDNAGFDATNILNKLRAKHAQGGMWYGVDINNEDIADNYVACVWEPSIVRINALTAASEAACLILSVDETIKNPRSSMDGPRGGKCEVEEEKRERDELTIMDDFGVYAVVGLNNPPQRLICARQVVLFTCGPWAQRVCVDAELNDADGMCLSWEQWEEEDVWTGGVVLRVTLEGGNLVKADISDPKINLTIKEFTPELVTSCLCDDVNPPPVSHSAPCINETAQVKGIVGKTAPHVVAAKRRGRPAKNASQNLSAVAPPPVSPSGRWGQTMCPVDEQTAILIGGQGTLAVGPTPEGRIGHTAVHDPDSGRIFVFGGSKNGKWFNDVHILDTRSWRWTMVEAQGKVPPLAYHSCSLFRGELFVLGGPIVTGDKPSPRSGHSACVMQERKIYVFGGWDTPVCYNDMYTLDLDDWESSIASQFLVHGGYNGHVALSDTFIFDIETNCWTEVIHSGLSVPRAGHSIISMAITGGQSSGSEEEGGERGGASDSLLVFGGGDNEGHFYSDLTVVGVRELLGAVEHS
ncbi:hypothetical protein NHX12_016581 [Muraenolepis orangiensis]|uniref:T-complex protein 1 subunit eta n=1 Tax=Muraenolepis orangiensis TaxID=630683 RepID=A0A9Q0D6Q2_9TELE|nr:hypothetical protein NHX12_016581 [Muraenolepis orangiensis]